jgi:hypothetical protein
MGFLAGCITNSGIYSAAPFAQKAKRVNCAIFSEGSNSI